MALFSKKTEEKKTAKADTMKVAKAVVNVGIPGIGVQFTLRPRVTEKASLLLESNVYAFDIPQEATKGSVRNAIVTLFKVHPVKIAIVKTTGKVKVARGKKGRTPGTKKAYVYLKKGDKIEIAA